MKQKKITKMDREFLGFLLNMDKETQDLNFTKFVSQLYEAQGFKTKPTEIPEAIIITKGGIQRTVFCAFSKKDPVDFKAYDKAVEACTKLGTTEMEIVSNQKGCDDGFMPSLVKWIFRKHKGEIVFTGNPIPDLEYYKPTDNSPTLVITGYSGLNKLIQEYK